MRTEEFDPWIGTKSFNLPWLNKVCITGAGE